MVQVHACDTTTNFVCTNATISNDSGDKQEGTASVLFTPTSAAWATDSDLNFADTDWSSYDTFKIWGKFQTDQSGNDFNIRIYAPDYANSFYYDLATPTSWTEFSIAFADFNENGAPDWSDVRYMFVRFTRRNNMYWHKVDDIRVEVAAGAGIASKRLLRGQGI